MLVATGFRLVPVAVDVNVLILAELDVLEDGADVIVLDVAHEERDMSAAVKIQKRPFLNSMTAVLIK